MIELAIFAVAAFGAVWARGKLDTVATAAAVLIAYGGAASMGWIGWAWSWEQAGWYAVLTVGLAGALGIVYRDRLAWRGVKLAQDYVALVAWGVIQQSVLLGWLAQINPWIAVVVFAVVHWPNRLLAAVTLAGGCASVVIAHHYGEPCIIAAGLAHAALSWFIRDVAGVSMCVGEGCSRERSAA